MNKRVWCLLLCVAMLISFVPISAAADELTFYQVMIDAGNGTQREKAIIEDGEIYIAASSFEKYTRYEYHEDMPGFLVKGQEEDKAFKKVLVNAQTKKAAVGTKLIELSNSFVVDGEAYLPFCQMLPMLNASIIDVDHSVIYIVNNDLSMAELLYDFTLEDYAFNIVDEFFGDEDSAKNYIGWAYLLDTVKDFRLDRLDVVFKSGESKDYQEIFMEYLKDDELFHKAMNSDENFAGYLLETIIDINSETESFYTIYEWFEKVGESDSANKVVQFIKTTSDSSVFDEDWYQIINVTHEDAFKLKIKDTNVASFSLADFYEAAGYVYSYLNHVADHPEMLDAVYGLTIPGKSASMFSINPEVTAANKVYHAYIDDFYPAMSKKLAETIVVKCAEEALENTTLGFYKLTFGLAGEVIDGIWPGDAGERAVLMYHSNIVTTATRRACVPTLNTQDETNDYRLSLLLTLIASRACYQTMAENKNGYQKYHDRYEEKIEKIENMIMGLYLVAGNVAFDTYENYEAFAEQNRQILKDAGMFEDIMPYPEVDESDYLAFLNDHPEYKYYTILDINGDGVIEMLATDRVQEDYTSAYNPVDLYVCKDGIITLAYDDLWSKYENLSYDSTNHWLSCGTGGTGASGMLLVYLDENTDAQEITIDFYWIDDSETPTIYFNGVNVTNTVNESYEKIVSDLEAGKPENVVFKSIPFSTDLDSFTEEVQIRYGKASHTEFKSCFETTIMDYPSSIVGFLTEASVDLDGNGNNEKLVLVSMDNSVCLQIYGESQGRYVQLSEKIVASLNYCSQQNISIFYNERMGVFLLFVDGVTSGAFTGNDSRSATIYALNYASIDLLSEATVDDYGTATDDIPTQLAIFGVPYANNCAKVDKITTQSQYMELLEIEHRTYGADPLGGWFGREHHLQLVTPEVRNRPVENDQTWTITVKSYQGFTEYREETWTREFQAGNAYTIYPAWKDGVATDYTVLSYTVDTEERTIEMFMDYPEGDSYWEGIVLDLAEETYYGMGYTTFD